MSMLVCSSVLFCFFFNDTATTEIYTLSLHDALPIFFVQASLERMMKCGVGICGSCCINEDLVCRDGTIFAGDYLMENDEFGHYFRAKSGILEKI